MPLPNIVRRVRLYKLLRTGQAYSVDELAAHFRVGRRTIHRDLAVLQRGSERIEFVEANGQGPVCLAFSVLEPRGIRC